MYKLEYLVFWYFQDKIEKSDSLKNKNCLNQKMRYILKVINQELDNSEKSIINNKIMKMILIRIMKMKMFQKVIRIMKMKMFQKVIWMMK